MRGGRAGGGGAVRVGGGLSQADRGLFALWVGSGWVRLMSMSCGWLLEWFVVVGSAGVGPPLPACRAWVGVPMWK